MPKNTKNVSDSDTTQTTTETVADNAAETTPAPAPKPLYEGIKNFVYVGTALPGGRLKSNTVLVGTYAEITEYYKDVIKEYPGVAKLIVPTARLAESREKVQKSGNLLNKYYQEIAEAIKAKGVDE